MYKEVVRFVWPTEQVRKDTRLFDYPIRAYPVTYSDCIHETF